MTTLHRTPHSAKERVELLGTPHQHNRYQDANHPGEYYTLAETDLGHKQGYEEKTLQYIAGHLNFTQREYNDMIRNSERYTGNGKTIFQPEYYQYNRNHQSEEYDALVSKHNGIVLCRNYRDAQRRGETKVERPSAAQLAAYQAKQTQRQQEREEAMKQMRSKAEQWEEERQKRLPEIKQKDSEQQSPKQKEAAQGKQASRSTAPTKACGKAVGTCTPARQSQSIGHTTSTGSGHSSTGSGHSSTGSGHSSTGSGHSSTGSGHSSTGGGHGGTGGGHGSTGGGHGSTGGGHGGAGGGHGSH